MTALAFPARRRVASDLLLRTAARGAILVGVAVVVGIVLLQVIDKGGGGGSAAPPPSGGGVTASTTATTGKAGRAPAAVRVLVNNGSGLSQAAATVANGLRGQGYAIAGTGNAALQPGTTVACRVGFEQEAAALSKALTGSTVVAFPTAPPKGSENADCVVIKGS